MKHFLSPASWASALLALAAVFNAGAAPLIDPTGVLLDQGHVTFDTRSGRQWLDLPQTSGFSYNDMKQQFGCDPDCVSGPFAGWRFAQAHDVRGLVTDAGLPYGADLLDLPDLPASIERLNLLITLLGGHITTDCDFGCGGVSGILNRILTADDLDGHPDYPPELFAGHVMQASMANISCCGDFWTGDNLSGPRNMTPYPTGPLAPGVATGAAGDPYFTNGVWLFRVPEPATPFLLAIAALVLIGMRRLASARTPALSWRRARLVLAACLVGASPIASAGPLAVTLHPSSSLIERSSVLFVDVVATRGTDTPEVPIAAWSMDFVYSSNVLRPFTVWFGDRLGDIDLLSGEVIGGWFDEPLDLTDSRLSFFELSLLDHTSLATLQQQANGAWTDSLTLARIEFHVRADAPVGYRVNLAGGNFLFADPGGNAIDSAPTQFSIEDVRTVGEPPLALLLAAAGLALLLMRARARARAPVQALVLVLGTLVVGAASAQTLMPLGDSATEALPGYRVPLINQLRLQGLRIDSVGSVGINTVTGPTLTDSAHEGHPGYTIGRIAALRCGTRADRLPQRYLRDCAPLRTGAAPWKAFAPAITVLMAGTNDFREWNWVAGNLDAATTISQRLDDLLLSLRPGAVDVFVVTIPPFDCKADAQGCQSSWFRATKPPSQAVLDAQIALYNEHVMALGARYSNVHPIDTRQLTLGDLSADGIHLSNAGYLLMANLATQRIVPVLLSSRLPGDLNRDGRVDVADIEIVTAALNQSYPLLNDPRDLDGDGVVTVLDARQLFTYCSNQPLCR